MKSCLSRDSPSKLSKTWKWWKTSEDGLVMTESKLVSPQPLPGLVTMTFETACLSVWRHMYCSRKAYSILTALLTHDSKCDCPPPGAHRQQLCNSLQLRLNREAYSGFNILPYKILGTSSIPIAYPLTQLFMLLLYSTEMQVFHSTLPSLLLWGFVWNMFAQFLPHIQRKKISSVSDDN